MTDLGALIDPEEGARIAAGRHDDPFAILGPHLRGGRDVVVAFDPGAGEMEILTRGSAQPMREVAGVAGLFIGEMPDPGAYRLRARAGGRQWEFEDPYRFAPVLGALDEHLFAEGTIMRLWQVLGAHVMEHEGVQGTHFALWAPNAAHVSVVGDFNFWDGRRHAMRRRGSTGIWEIFLPGVGVGALYKYQLISARGDVLPLKADPVGFGAQMPPETASVVRDLTGHDWQDGAWMQVRGARQDRSAPISIYEVHLGSWQRHVFDDNSKLSYEEAAGALLDHVAQMGFTHIEFLPLSEYPFDGSWGYQPIGLYAPTVRHGTPEGLRALIEAAHAREIGVLLDWVPGHFPADEHGLRQFDGTALYEYGDPREGFHRDWNTLIYNYGRTEVVNFLVSNALYWLEEYHIDGLRVDAVASMLYRDYSREPGEWVPNRHGGRENLEAIGMLRRMNTLAYGEAEGVMTAAEESTSFPAVSRPVHEGGLGFGYKWNMGWMNDTLDYMSRDPVHRKYHHNQMTFGLTYAFSENFILPLSHDEVVHGKGSMLDKMPGDEWQKFANLRAYYGFMWAHPGKKLLFQGNEFAQKREWDYNAQLEWAQADAPRHRGVMKLVRDLNGLYRAEPSMHVRDCEAEGFAWIEADDAAHSILAWLRHGHAGDPAVAVVCNFTPIGREGWALGLPAGGHWREAINTDALDYGGSGRGNLGGIEALEGEAHGLPWHARVTLPPLSTLIFVHESGDQQDGRTQA